MKKFNCIVYDINKNKFVLYDVMPYFVRSYNETKNKPKTHKEFVEFVKRVGLCQFWGRCEWEVILTPWPPVDHDRYDKKIDVWEQIEANLDVVVKLLEDYVNGN